MWCLWPITMGNRPVRLWKLYWPKVRPFYLTYVHYYIIQKSYCTSSLARWARSISMARLCNWHPVCNVTSMCTACTARSHAVTNGQHGCLTLAVATYTFVGSLQKWGKYHWSGSWFNHVHSLYVVTQIGWWETLHYSLSKYWSLIGSFVVPKFHRLNLGSTYRPQVHMTHVFI